MGRPVAILALACCCLVQARPSSEDMAVMSHQGRALQQARTQACTRDRECLLNEVCDVDKGVCVCAPSLCRCQSARTRSCVAQGTRCPAGFQGPTCGGTCKVKMQCPPFMTCSSTGGLRCECMKGFAPCDGKPADGCKVNLLTDPSNCNACGRACGPNAACTNGICACLPGFADVNKDLGKPKGNGCEVFLRGGNVNHCNAVSRKCGSNTACITSSKGIGECVCMPAFIDRNKNIGKSGGDGCETEINFNPNFCGEQGKYCGPNAECQQRRCTCHLGYADANKDLGVVGGDGCEADLASTDHCGRPKNKCGPNTVCKAGECECLPTHDDVNMDMGLFAGDGCETEILSDLENCGGAKKKCGDNQICQAGRCVCMPGYIDTDGSGCYTNVLFNITCCGSACAQCGPGPNMQCRRGQCECATGFSAPCPERLNNEPCAPLNLTDGCQVDLTSDPSNCGELGKTCGADAECRNGVCACMAGFGDMNEDLGQAGDGCEVDLTSDDSHCGQLNNPCNANSECRGRFCTCRTGFYDKDEDGICEINLLEGVTETSENGTISINYCGFPTTSCDGKTQQCKGGFCVCLDGFIGCTDPDPESGVLSCITRDQCCTDADCHSTQTCNTSSHVCECKPGLSNCDGLAWNGCEVGALTSRDHCGSCNVTCTAGQTCAQGGAGQPYSCSTPPPP